MNKHCFISWAFIDPKGRLLKDIYRTKNEAFDKMIGHPNDKKKQKIVWKNAKRDGWILIKVLVSKISNIG